MLKIICRIPAISRALGFFGFGPYKEYKQTHIQLFLDLKNVGPSWAKKNIQA
jgi:hypothetical protein